ncbi:MAG: T9SS type A sorting domain-containing protein [Cyclobacteriaceae bacterium]
MKKIYHALVAVCLFTTTNLMAQVEITFNVDTRGETVDSETVYLASQDLGWSDQAMTDIDGDGIYSITVTQQGVIANYENYQMLFKIGSISSESGIPVECGGNDGNGGTTRFVDASQTTSYTFLYNGCELTEWDGSWSDTPDGETYYSYKINENWTPSQDTYIRAGSFEVLSGKTVTISSGSTLELVGKTVIGSDLKNSESLQDYEGVTDVTTVSSIPNWNPNSTSTINTSDFTSDVFQYTHGVDGESRFDVYFDVPADGDYIVSFQERSNTTDWVRRIFPTGESNFETSTDWTEISTSTTISLQEGQNSISYRLFNLNQELYIDDLKATLVTLSANASGGDLEVESGASLIAPSSFGREVTFKRNTSFGDAEAKYSFVGSPVNQSADITGADLGSDVYSYDESVGFDSDAGLSRWVDASSEELVPGIGYTQTSQEELVFTGFPNVGSIMVNGLTKTTTGTASAGDQGWHLLSNPYGAAIDVSSFLTENTSAIENSISIWDDGQGTFGGRGNGGSYITANAIATVNGSTKDFEGYIGSMQGFFVKVVTDGESVNFTDDMIASGNNADANFFRKTEDSQTSGIKVSISNDNFYSELFVGLVEDATVGYDAKYDASKLIGNDNLEFYSIAQDMRFAIQALPFQSSVSTELAFDLGEFSELTFNTEELNGLEEGMTFMLHDAVTRTTYDLSETQSFNFSSAAGTDQNRFTLTYGTKDILSNNVVSNQPIYRYFNSELTVDFGKQLTVSEYAVYDLSGKLVLKNKNDFQNIETLNISLNTKGINIVKISTSEGVFTRKFIF